MSEADVLTEGRVGEKSREEEIAASKAHFERLLATEPNPDARATWTQIIKMMGHIPPSKEVMEHEAKLASADPEERRREGDKDRKEAAERTVKYLTEAELRRKYPELNDTSVDNLRRLDRLSRLPDFISFLSKETKIEGRKEAPGEVLRKKDADKWYEEDWGKYNGWTNEEIRKVGGRLKRGFELTGTRKDTMGTGATIQLDGAQIHTVLEQLVAAGTTPEQVREMFEAIDTDPNVRESIIEQGINESGYRSETRESNIRLHFFHGLGLEFEYIKKFILPKDFADELKANYYNDYSPQNAEELAWQIIFGDPEKWGLNYKKWGVNGAAPAMEMRVFKEKDKETGEETGAFVGDYYINVPNLNRNPRARMMYWIGEDPKKPHDYFSEVYMLKSFNSHYTIRDMFEGEQTVFKSKDGETSYQDLANHWRIEAGLTTFLRELELNYEILMGKDEELVTKMTEIFSMNPLTRRFLLRNAMFYLENLPLNYDGVRSDVRLGKAWNEMQLAYYHIGDFEKLQKILGEDSSFFTKQGMLRAIHRVILGHEHWEPEVTVSTFLGPDNYALFDRLYDEHGNIKPSETENFIKFINFYNYKGIIPETNLLDTVREAMRGHIAKKYDIYLEHGEGGENAEVDDTSLRWAEILAWCFSRISGASSRNELSGRAYDALSKMTLMDIYREQQVELAGQSGYPKQMKQFRQLLPSYLEGTETMAPHPVTDSRGNVIGVRKMTQLEALEELQQLATKQKNRIDELQQKITGAGSEEERQKWIWELKNYTEEATDIYRERAGKLEMKETAMRFYATEVMSPALTIFNKIISSSEFDFDKYTEFGVFGIKMKRAELQEGLIENFFKPLRIMWGKYEQLNFNQMVRGYVPVGKGNKHEFRDITLAERMFGYEMLDRKEFWVLNSRGKPETDPDTGRHVIDSNKINTEWGKKVLWKSFALMEMASRIREHRELHSTDQRYNFTYYLDIIETLKAIPGQYWGDDESMKSMQVVKQLFSKDDIKWLKKIGGLSNFKIYGGAIFETFFRPKSHEGSGWAEFFRAFFHHAKPQVQ